MGVLCTVYKPPLFVKVRVIDWSSEVTNDKNAWPHLNYNVGYNDEKGPGQIKQEPPFHRLDVCSAGETG